MKLLIDSASVRSPGGERLQAELCKALDRTVPAGASGVVLRRPDQTALAGFDHLETIVAAAPPAGLAGNYLAYHSLLRYAQRASADAVFAAGGFFSRQLARRYAVVATANNMLPFHPKIARMGTTWRQRLRIKLQRRMTLRCLARADAVLLHSRHALDTLVRCGASLPEPVTVVLTGAPSGGLLCEGAPAPGHPNGGRDYLFYFSGIQPYKNHLRLVEAYRLMVERAGDVPELLFAGVCKDPIYLGRVQDRIEAVGLGGRVRYLGRLPESSLTAWLHHATINVFPSLCETGSLIVSEVLGAEGVLASARTPPMPEIAESAAEYFDPESPEDIAATVLRLWRAPGRQAALRELGRQRVRMLDWDQSGRALWQSAQVALHRRSLRPRGSAKGG